MSSGTRSASSAVGTVSRANPGSIACPIVVRARTGAFEGAGSEWPAPRLSSSLLRGAGVRRARRPCDVGEVLDAPSTSVAEVLSRPTSSSRPPAGPPAKAAALEHAVVAPSAPRDTGRRCRRTRKCEIFAEAVELFSALGDTDRSLCKECESPPPSTVQASPADLVVRSRAP